MQVVIDWVQEQMAYVPDAVMTIRFYDTVIMSVKHNHSTILHGLNYVAPDYECLLNITFS